MTRQEFQTRIIAQNAVMFKTAFALTRNEDEACDLVQDTMVRLWNSRDILDDIENPSAYCITAVKRRFFDSIRANRPTQELTDVAEEASERTDLYRTPVIAGAGEENHRDSSFGTEDRHGIKFFRRMLQRGDCGNHRVLQ